MMISYEYSTAIHLYNTDFGCEEMLDKIVEAECKIILILSAM